MKSKTLLLLVLGALPCSIGIGLSQQVPNKTPSYDLINLGTPLGGPFAIATGISYGGFLGGYANLPSNDQHAILWYPDSTKDLGTLGGPNSALLENFSGFSETSTADPLNQDFCATGNHLICLPITVVKGKAVTLPLLGGSSGAAFGNNEVGQVAGVAQTTVHDPTCLVGGEPVAPFNQVLQGAPAIWTHGRVRQLFLPSGDTEGGANAVNDFGQAAGSTGDCVSNPAAHPVFWRSNGKPVILPTLGGLMNNNALGVNDFGQTIGTSDLTGDLTGHAVLWQYGGVQDLGTLPGDYSSYAESINNFGQIVGSSCDVNFNCRAFLWQKGQMYDLNTLIASNPNLSLVLGSTIDDAGVILGYAYDQSSATSPNPAFVAIPGVFLSSLEASPSAVRSEAAPRVSMPENMRTKMQQKLKQGRMGRFATN